MYYIAYRVDTHDLLEYSSVTLSNGDYSGLAGLIAPKHGTTAGNVFVYFPSQSEADRLRNSDEYQAVWSGDAVSSLDFSPEDAKNWIRITTNKTRILGDNSDTAVITIEVLQAANKAQRLNYNGTQYLPVQDPFRREIEFPLTFSAGVATINFATNRAYAGLWHFPHESVGLRFGNLRFDGKAKISVLYV